MLVVTFRLINTKRVGLATGGSRLY